MMDAGCRMQERGKLPEKVQDVLNRGVIKRLPLTFLPFVNQQLREWNYLFPNERQSVERLLLYVDGMSQEQSDDLFRPVVELEEEMGVRNWKQFSKTEQTIQNSSLLASTPNFQDWRRAVQAVFDVADARAIKNGVGKKTGNRLVLLDIPHPLSVDPANAWRRWHDLGKPVQLDLDVKGRSSTAFEFLLAEDTGNTSTGLLTIARNRAHSSAADVWVVDAAKTLPESILTQSSASGSSSTILLNYGRLDALRQSFSHEMNTMRKDLADADAVFDHLRKVDVVPMCPPEVAADPATCEFVRALYLSGNGAVIFSNSFVEWASSEALRRARPVFLAARFGVRTKPKPFTGVAVFGDPDKINPLPPVDDLPGSSMDAQILALYVWLAASRYAEYKNSTLCVCLAESLSEAYIVAPPGFTFQHGDGPLPLEELRRDLSEWIA